MDELFCSRKNKKCVIYIRVSSERQVQGYSLEGQNTKNPLSALCRERIFFYDGQRRERRRRCSYSLLSGTITVAK